MRSAPAGINRTARFAIGPSGPVATPDTATDGENRIVTSTPARDSPDPSVTTVASALLLAEGASVVWEISIGQSGGTGAAGPFCSRTRSPTRIPSPVVG